MTTPFTDYNACIQYRLHQNPARQKSYNPHEPDSGGSNYYAEHFSGKHPHDWYASIVRGIDKALHGYDPQEKYIFYLCEYLRYPYYSVAKMRGRSKNAIPKLMGRMRLDIKREFIRRELIPDDKQREGRLHS